MSPFRLFGPPPEPEPVAPADDTRGVTWAPGPWASDPAPATRHARPVGLGPRSAASAPGPAHRFGLHDDADPPTDPHGFPPVHAGLPPSWSTPLRPAPPAEPPLDAREAAALAGAFAADYLSWDEDDPQRRGRALAGHLAASVEDPAQLGWNGVGRQRAEFALPGTVRPDGDDRVLVDVRVRVTPYRAVGERTVDGAVPEPDVPGVPAAAPAPVMSGWHASASYWVRLIVPVVRDDGRLAVDAGEETGIDATQGADEPHAEAAGPRPVVPDPPASALPPLTRVPDREPDPGGAW